MNSRRTAIVPITIALASLPFVAVGARLRESSPRFENWLDSLSISSDMGHGTGVALATWWVSVSVFWLLGSLFFTGLFLLFTTLLVRIERGRSLVAILSVLFALLCVWIAVAVGRDAANDFQWGFSALAVGECLTGVALCWGAIDMLRTCRKNRTAVTRL
jgi:hypothetical protein